MERKRTATRRSGRALDPALLAPKAHGRAEPVVGLLPQPAHWLTGGGEMGDLIRAKDWSATPLGPLHAWPESLRTTVRIVLAQRFPMLLWWGPQYIQIYNDAYIPIPGAKHPQRALGVPVSECWSEIWHILRPLIDTPFKGGPSTWIEDIRLDIDRHGFTEETHFTIAYSPVPDDSAPGGIGGVLATVHEITEKVIGERRIALLRDLGAGSADARTAEDACAIAARTLSSHAIDVPFALIYLTDEHGRRARLAATAGVAIGEPVSPGAIELGAPDQGEWPLARARTDSHIVEVRDLETRFARLPKDSSGAPPHTAAVIPIPSALAHRPAGFLVAAVSPRLRWDEQYRSFLQLAASQIATAIANARAYDEERRRAEALAEIDRAKTAFFSNVSHEFRTPLTLMLGPLADALASPGGALGGAALHAAHRNAQRMLKLVNALLDFSRIEAGRVQAAFEPIDLAATTAELAGVFRSAVERAGLRLVVRCEPLGEPVYVDTVMWEKIVLNLLSNAFKFTFEGEIEVALARTLDGIELKVRDTGIGIAAQDIPKIFERFRRIEGAKARTHEGSGIGLSLVQELVRIHGGRIDAHSEPGKGTTFTVALKRGRGHLPEERVGAARELASTATRAQAYADEALGWLGEPADDDPAISPASAHDPDAGMRVLVADDNADMREYVARLLRARWTVATVANGEAALAALRRERFDLVLTDVMMPRLDGFGLLRAIRSDPALAATPVVMLSARAGEEARIEGLDAGADDYLIKPFGGRELVARVRSQLALLAARRAAERERAELLAREQAAKREAQLQREHLVSLFMQAPNPIVMLRGREHVIQLANPPACRLWGRQPAQVVGRPLLEALPDLRGQVFKELLDRVLHTGVPFEGKEVPANLDPAGDGSVETVYLNFVYAPMRGVTGEIEGVLVVAFDVTDQVRAREQMTRLHAEAEQASRSKDQFLAMLGHELRGPLSPIVNALQILRLRGVQSREQDIVERQVGQIVRLVDDLLDVSRITQGKIDLRRRPVEMADVVVRALETASPLVEQRSQRVEVRMPRAGLLVDADPERMAQVVANLLTNAAKYSEPGSIILVAGRREDERVVVSVADPGIGIAPDMVDRIFEIFVQQPQTLAHSAGGLGLGLAIVRRLVEMHGGTVTAKSGGRGRGSEFVVVLPAVDAAADAG